MRKKNVKLTIDPNILELYRQITSNMSQDIENYMRQRVKKEYDPRKTKEEQIIQKELEKLMKYKLDLAYRKYKYINPLMIKYLVSRGIKRAKILKYCREKNYIIAAEL